MYFPKVCGRNSWIYSCKERKVYFRTVTIGFSEQPSAQVYNQLIFI